MARTEWGEEYEEQQATIQGGVPVWAWFCGIGCLLMLLFGAGASFFGWRLFQEANDDEANWARLREHMPFEEQPTGYDIAMGMSMFGTGQVVLLDQRQDVAPDERFASMTLHFFSGSAAAGADELFKPGMLDVMVEDHSLGTALVQGREVRALWFNSKGQEAASLAGDEHNSVRIDLGERGGDRRVLELRKGAVGGALIEDDLESWLSPFDLWGQE